MRTTFLVGRVTRKGSEMVVVEGAPAAPIPGPWTLRALVRPNARHFPHPAENTPKPH